MRDDGVTEIDISFPDAADLHLRIAVGACRLRIVPGESGAWVKGSYRDPSGALPASIIREGGTLRITQEPNWANIFGWLSGVPTFELALGKERPFSLTLETGASECELDLGGVPLSRLVGKYGAGTLKIDFSTPNPQAMTMLNLAAGAGNLEMHNLANANCAEIVVEGGAAAYHFDFGGELRRDAHMRIQSGLSSVQIAVPAATAAKIAAESVTGGLAVGDGFTKREGAFWTSGAIAGGRPVLTVHASIALGSLTLSMI